MISFLIFFIIYIKVKQKYVNFVLQNSCSLQKLKDINRKYKFYKETYLVQTYTYDNEKIYNSISCLDYLTYQLQCLKDHVNKQIQYAKYNKRLFSDYLNEIATLNKLGNYLTDPQKLKLSKLLIIEKDLINKNKLPKPSTEFFVKVSLYCAKMNGIVYASKTQTFYEEEINALIKKLNNKTQTFYKDREIWDSICRVERGKVSNEIRFSIYKRDGYRCCICGASQHETKLEIDHIIPISKGGKSTEENLQTLCHNCNIQKGNDKYY